MKDYKTTLYYPDGRTCAVRPKNGKDFKAKELQEFVKGYFEILYLQNEMIMIINDEGLLKGLPANIEATRIAYENGKDYTIVGDVLVCPTQLVK